MWRTGFEHGVADLRREQIWVVFGWGLDAACGGEWAEQVGRAGDGRIWAQPRHIREVMLEGNKGTAVSVIVGR